MKIIRPVVITDAIYTASNIPEDDYPVYNPATTYGEGDRVISTTAHRIYESLVAGNTGNALTDKTKWLDLGATNKWAMFDGKIGRASEEVGGIEITLTPAGKRINALAFFGMAAQSLDITIKDGLGATLYTYSRDLVDNSMITSYWAYFFEERTRLSELVIDVPQVISPVIEIVLDTEPSSTATLGELVIGLSQSLGCARYGTSVGIIDYSRKDRDEFGNAIIIERDFSYRVDYDLIVDTNAVRGILSTLATYRATPLVWVGVDGDESYGATQYGYYRDFDIILSGPYKSEISIQVESLT